jgi:hypothetical protein
VALAIDRNPRQGRMKKHLATTTIFTLLALAVSAAPASASSGPLLSGYGGPGQGSQAILGSTLLNGPSGGSPGSGSGSAAGNATAGGGNAARPGSSSAPGSSHSSRHLHGKRSRASAPAHAGGSSAAGVGAYSASDEAATPRAHAIDSSTLGLSGSDLLYLLLALCALALTAVLTRGLVRGGRGGSAHG